jgi:hypothetical protein
LLTMKNDWANLTVRPCHSFHFKATSSRAVAAAWRPIWHRPCCQNPTVPRPALAFAAGQRNLDTYVLPHVCTKSGWLQTMGAKTATCHRWQRLISAAWRAPRMLPSSSRAKVSTCLCHGCRATVLPCFQT